MCMRVVKNKFAVSRKTHETKLNKVSSHNLKVEIHKKIKADILVKHAILINKDRFANIFMKDDCISFLLLKYQQMIVLRIELSSMIIGLYYE